MVVVVVVVAVWAQLRAGTLAPLAVVGVALGQHELPAVQLDKQRVQHVDSLSLRVPRYAMSTCTGPSPAGTIPRSAMSTRLHHTARRLRRVPQQNKSV